ncbi:MAG: hypothetical protein Q4G33_10320, partial [bacterium]|nr:hypothetical protein [bacterium]
SLDCNFVHYLVVLKLWIVKCKWVGKGGRKQVGFDFYDMTSEELALTAAKGYREFFNDRICGASQKNLYSGCAALCWTDSAQHGRQSFSENARMSGRVDAARVKKQNFEVFRVMQSSSPAIKIIGHWNYPEVDSKNYLYHKKRFNGVFWEDTEETDFRDAAHKTVYVFGSYCISCVMLEINGKVAGICNKPIDTFVFPFENIDITERGVIKAYGIDYNGKRVCVDEILTAGEPTQINMNVHTAPDGLRADGNDVAYIDIDITDNDGNICPLCFDRIDFSLSGKGVFLGGYNSGKFDGYGNESVIHKSYLYAECGKNRVFIRSTEAAGKIKLKAQMGNLQSEIEFESNAVPLDTLTECEQAGIYENYAPQAINTKMEFIPIPQADNVKYTPEKEPICKILINGQEPDTRGVRSVNLNGRVWGAALCIFERLRGVCNFDYKYLPTEKCLIVKSEEYTVEARAGQTHLLVNGSENLMDGEPYVTERGQFVMEISAIVPYISGVSAYYDDKINAFRISTDINNSIMI